MRRYLAVGTALGALALFAPAASADIGGAGLGDPYYPEDGNSGYRVGHYDVRLAYDPAEPGSLTGDTTVNATATVDLDRFDLDLTGFEVGAVTIDGEPARTFSRAGKHELVITPRARIRKGAAFAVRVRYSGEPTGEGWYRFEGGAVAALGEPHSATAWYPANDHPSDKATFSLTATVPDGWTVVSNGRPGPTTSDAGKRTFRWNEERPMATYTGMMAIGRFTVRTSALSDGTPVINTYAPGTTPDPDVERQSLEIHDFLIKTFGPYPFTTAGFTALDGGPVALETQERATFSGVPWDAPLAHETAHQWFGNSVSFGDWRNGCLSECFAQYANQLWDKRDGGDLDNGFYYAEVNEHRNDPGYWAVRLYDPGPGKELDGALYDRGSLMVHALRRTVGDEMFFPMMRKWLADHRYGNATWPEFERFAQRCSGRDLEGFFQAWAHGTVIPPERYLTLPTPKS